MAFSKIILNGVVQIDLTQDTVTDGDLFSSITAHDASGVSITGTLVNGNNITYGIVDNTSTRVGVGKVGSVVI